jgi:HSP20 family protein
MVETTQQNALWPNLYAPFRHLGSRLSEWLSPASDASSDKDAYRISMELPGVPEDGIELSVDGGVLTVRGEKTAEREEKGETWFFSEREYGAFRRSFRLPPDSDQDKVEAHLKDGVLTVVVPRRSAPDTGGRTISVKKA